MKKLLAISMLTIAALAIVPGCKSSQSTAGCKCDPCTCASPCPCGQKSASLGMMNDSCPMSGKKLKDTSPNSTWNGSTVGFCGNGCKSKFDGMNSNKKTAYIANVKAGN